MAVFLKYAIPFRFAKLLMKFPKLSKSQISTTCLIETGAKKSELPKIWLLIQKPYFLSDPADILVILFTHELGILIKFHCNREKIVEFLILG